MAEDTVADLAREVLSGEPLRSFLALPAHAQLVGLAALAHIGGDARVRDAMLRRRPSGLSGNWMRCSTHGDGFSTDCEECGVLHA